MYWNPRKPMRFASSLSLEIYQVQAKVCWFILNKSSFFQYWECRKLTIYIYSRNNFMWCCVTWMFISHICTIGGSQWQWMLGTPWFGVDVTQSLLGFPVDIMSHYACSAWFWSPNTSSIKKKFYKDPEGMMVKSVYPNVNIQVGFLIWRAWWMIQRFS